MLEFGKTKVMERRKAAWETIEGQDQGVSLTEKELQERWHLVESFMT